MRRGVDAVPLAAGALLTLAFVYVAAARGPTIGLGALVGVTAFLAVVYAFVRVPHIAVAVTIPLFAFLPALKVLVNPKLGPVKDVVVFAAAIAALSVTVVRRRFGPAGAVDRWLAICAALFLLLYLVDVGGNHDIAWAHGVRLTAEPILLLFTGLTLGNPRRTLRWALVSLVATGCVVAAVGLGQQALGGTRLAGYGYAYDLQIRTYHGHLRSFGTLDEPFAYAAFLMLALAAVAFWMRRGAVAAACGLIILFGVGVSFVRTAVLISIAFCALELTRHRKAAAAVAVSFAVVAASIAVGIRAQGSESTTYRAPSAVLTLNGRTSAWRNAFGTPVQWFVGQGVGKIGTAAERARYVLAESSAQTLQNQQAAVDSGYFATVADVGLIGLGLLLAILGRILFLSRRAQSEGRKEGLLALALTLVLMLDALTRSSFIGFPSAFLGMLLIGLALNAAAAPKARRP